MKQIREKARRTFRYLALSGGGMKGMAYIGVRWRLEKLGLWKDIREIAGTSAGALFGTIFAMGATFWDVLGIYMRTKPKDFAGNPVSPLSFYRLLMKGGGVDTAPIRDWIGAILERFAGNADLTFGELAKLAKRDPKYRKLIIYTYNITWSKVIAYRAETHPDAVIRDALCGSIAIPIVFVNREIDGEPHHDAGHIVNYPINAWGHDNDDAIGVNLINPNEPEPIEGRGLVATIQSTWQYMCSTFSRVEPHDEKRTIRIDTRDVGTTDFALKPGAAWVLIEDAERQTLKEAREKGMVE